MKQLALAALVGLVVGGGGGFLLAYEPAVNWSKQEGKIASALSEVFTAQNAPKELVGKVSSCMAGLVVKYLAENGCELKAPTDTNSSLRVIEVCVGPAAGLLFQQCVLENK